VASAHPWNLRRELGEEYGRLYSDAYGIEGSYCIELKNENASNDAKIYLGDCTGPGWRMDSRGMFHSEQDDNQCMQAGRSGNPRDGTKLRMYKCNKSKKHQKFKYLDDDVGSSIRPKVDESLCVVYHGEHADYGDEIILRKCNKVDDQAGWSTDGVV
jgi:hypothetical protein